jgi:cytosine/adenosine deaminase-related metal-dependent hydrolase
VILYYSGNCIIGLILDVILVDQGIQTLHITNAAQLLSMQVTIESGALANFVILEAKSAIGVIREIAQPLEGFKHGKQTFSNKKAKIYF